MDIAVQGCEAEAVCVTKKCNRNHFTAAFMEHSFICTGLGWQLHQAIWSKLSSSQAGRDKKTLPTFEIVA